MIRHPAPSGLPPTGIPYVIVNGTIVVREGKVLPVKPGLPIRFTVEAKGRYEPVNVNKWLSDFSINVPDMHEADDTGAGQALKHKKIECFDGFLRASSRLPEESKFIAK